MRTLSAVTARAAVGALCGTFVVGLVVLVAALAPTTPAALAASGGYGPTTAPPASPGSGFSSVVTTQTVTSSGGTVTGSAYGSSVIVDVPASTLPDGGEVAVTAEPPSLVDAGPGNVVVADFGVAIINPDTGAALPGPFEPPVSVTMANPSIEPPDAVLVISAPGTATPVSGATVTHGQAVFSFTDDPDFAVTHSSAPIPGATVVTTGEFWAGTLPVYLLTAMAVSGLALIFRRRRPLA